MSRTKHIALQAALGLTQFLACVTLSGKYAHYQPYLVMAVAYAQAHLAIWNHDPVNV